jgi:hypothetical protein
VPIEAREPFPTASVQPSVEHELQGVPPSDDEDIALMCRARDGEEDER